MEAATAEREDTGAQPGVDVPQGSDPLTGHYVVLAAGAAADTVERVSGKPGSGPDQVPEQLTYQGQYEASYGGDAKRQAMKAYPDLAEAVSSDGLWLVAVPARSWRPNLAREKQRDPVIEGLD